ncbi:MAG: hypothetical protein IBX61_00945 [Thermoleophilia bacterium]|nr:hypothetical protein [Thermoleophilia bacterium]
MRLRSGFVISLATLAAAALLLIALLFIVSCGENRAGLIDQDQYERIQRGMTMDEVESITGIPTRTHRTGPATDPNIIWYFDKKDGEGLIRISFVGGKVDSVSPFDPGVEQQE